jgi:hypothetical protein
MSAWCLLPWGWVFAETMEVTHSQFQVIDEAGNSRFQQDYPQADKVVLEGILLNSPEQWLDPTPDPTVAPWYMGGQWEIYIQGEGSDHAGTACWMGQNYGNGPGYDNYTNQQWQDEIYRLNRDPQTGYVFRPGDRVRVTGRFLFYAGKLNINENHDVGPGFDFTMELIKPMVGLPQPEAIKLSDLVVPSDAGDGRVEPIFDADRLQGPEYYQARLVRIEDVNIVDPENWGPDADITVQDANGLNFPVHLCLGVGFSQYPCPLGWIDMIGIMDQEASGYPPDPKTGYRLLVLDYDGNGYVVGTLSTQRGNLPGDVNGDFRVDVNDVDILEENLGREVAGLAE